MAYEGITFRGSRSGQIHESRFLRQNLKPDEVAIKVTHSGICGTDLHFIHADMVLGHEGIGIVQEIGENCKALRIGDRVGWGYTYWSCGRCSACLTGHESYCPTAGKYGAHHLDQGSFGNLAIKSEQWVFKIPDGIESKYAAPLLCAGATVFSPMIEFLKPTDRVGIIGVGGLGHLAIQFAAKMGCDVIALSSTELKREDAINLGAREFYATDGVADYFTLNVTKPLDSLIITTGSENLDLANYYKLLKPVATVIPLTISFEPMLLPTIPTIANGIKIVGTTPSGILIMIQTLEFAERNNIRPIIQEFPMTEAGIMEAMEKLRSGEIRYRAVLSWQLASEST
ncbi:MAG: NADP-dependent alcohol dehydrogenase [Lentinula lateritia]|uniref:NADP-dependent alcohol dehydrogenase n=1 Tax=Lentinula lateritia TaxID=40482 RepID=A0ABQ8VXK5_9AGAR|nr:MAG: NADP-dependent alcohol dehydrogenase [Lentinula lateritia]KAJ4501126.1 NADP-dependent alcohol dehydrogenase [Lentinula lateritia]